LSHPPEGAVGVPADTKNARAIAVGKKQKLQIAHLILLSRPRKSAKDTATAHWDVLCLNRPSTISVITAQDTDMGSSDLLKPPGEVASKSHALWQILKTYVRNIALWLAPAKSAAELISVASSAAWISELSTVSALTTVVLMAR